MRTRQPLAATPNGWARSTRLVPLILAPLALSALVALPAGGSVATASPAQAPAPVVGIGIRLLDAPVSAKNDPRARVYIVDNLAPGTTVHRRIGITNGAGSTAHVLLYATAATIGDGTFVGAGGHTQNDVSSWTSVSPKSANIAAGASVTATVTIAVPSDAPAGEGYAAVWAETDSAATEGSAITQVSRVGIRMYLSVGPGGGPASNFAIDSLTAKRAPGGQPTVVASVDNTGGRALDMSGSLAMTAGPAGLSAGPFPATLGVTLAPGQTEPVIIALDKQLPDGPWHARITLTSGLIVRSAQATITFPSANSSAGGGGGATVWATPVNSSGHVGLYVAGAAGVAVVGAAAGGGFILQGRRRRRLRRPGV